MPAVLSRGAAARIFMPTPARHRFRRAARQDGGGRRRRGLGVRRRRRWRSKHGAAVGASVRAAAGARLGADQPGARLSRCLRQLPVPARRVRWHQAIRYRRAGSTAPADAIERCLQFANFHLHLAAPWQGRARGGRARSSRRHPARSYRFDFAIAGTGYFVDPGAGPSWPISRRISCYGATATCRRRVRRTPYLGAHPYLGAGHEYLEKMPGAAPYLPTSTCRTRPGSSASAVPVGDVPSMKRGIAAIVARISRDLFLADLDAHERADDGRCRAGVRGGDL